MSRVYNFSSGPAALPYPVLEQAQQEMLDWHDLGMNVMEMSHRSEAFLSILSEAKRDLRDLLAIPEHYRILFLQGGASLQFAQVPLNLLGDKTHIDMVNTGHWSTMAYKEASRYATVRYVANAKENGFAHIPDSSTWECHSDAAYLHYVSNETIGGLQFPDVPELMHPVPLVCDMSSDFLSREFDINRFGLIFAGAQKNIGPAGLVVVLIREDLLGKAKVDIPTLLNYQTMAEADSLYNTPATYAIYIAGLVFKWLKAQGGVSAIEAINREKADLLYNAIDASEGFYSNPIQMPFRSKMNVVFRLRDEALNDRFLAEADSHKLIQLKGHRVAGGMRASIYNAMPLSGVLALVNFMENFAKRYG